MILTTFNAMLAMNTDQNIHEDEDEDDLSNAELLIDGNRGIYVGQEYAKYFSKCTLDTSVSAEDLDTLMKGPDDEFYLDAWSNVLDNAILLNDHKKRFTLYQDGDLWAIPVTE